MKAHLFAYGTLEIPAVMFAVTGQHYRGEAAVLPDYSRFLLVNKHYPGIVFRQNARVNGVLYRNLSPRVWQRLDRYEDVFYQRQRVKIVTAKGEILNAWTYIIPGNKQHLLSPIPWSRHYFIKHRLRRFIAGITRRVNGQHQLQRV
jgi:gamma-glutamylcyclotransferase (GGCT)/AIG2-like uncharacterized protein YtfP